MWVRRMAGRVAHTLPTHLSVVFAQPLSKLLYTFLSTNCASIRSKMKAARLRTCLEDRLVHPFELNRHRELAPLRSAVPEFIGVSKCKNFIGGSSISDNGHSAPFRQSIVRTISSRLITSFISDKDCLSLIRSFRKRSMLCCCNRGNRKETQKEGYKAHEKSPRGISTQSYSISGRGRAGDPHLTYSPQSGAHILIS